MRKYVSLFLFYAIIAMSVSGVILYIMPHGRIAYWTGWRFLGLNKDQWDSFHTIFGFLMVFAGVWHVVLNWRSIVNYLKGKTETIASREFLVTTVFVFFVIVGTISSIPPFRTVMSVGNAIKESWPKPEVMLPVPHAELFSIDRIAGMVGLTTREAVNTLREKGIKVISENEALKEIAEKNNITPARIYKILLDSSGNRGIKSGLKIGNLTINEACEKFNIPVDKCIDKLAEHDIAVKSSQITVRDLALKNGKRPYEIIRILEESQ